MTRAELLKQAKSAANYLSPDADISALYVEGFLAGRDAAAETVNGDGGFYMYYDDMYVHAVKTREKIKALGEELK